MRFAVHFPRFDPFAARHATWTPRVRNEPITSKNYELKKKKFNFPVLFVWITKKRMGRGYNIGRVRSNGFLRGRAMGGIVWFFFHIERDLFFVSLAFVIFVPRFSV